MNSTEARKAIEDALPGLLMKTTKLSLKPNSVETRPQGLFVLGVRIPLGFDRWGYEGQLHIKVGYSRWGFRTQKDGSFTHYDKLVQEIIFFAENQIAEEMQKD